MAVYMLLLGCLPCSDGSDCTDEAVATAVSHNESPGHDEHRKHCTPFCVCACCAVPVVQMHTAIVLHHFSVAVPGAALYDEDFSSRNLHNIWQPPRVAFNS